MIYQNLKMAIFLTALNKIVNEIDSYSVGIQRAIIWNYDNIPPSYEPFKKRELLKKIDF